MRKGSDDAAASKRCETAMSETSKSYPLALPITENPYRTLRFFAGYGKHVAWVAALIVGAGGLAFWQFGYGAVWAPIGVILGFFVFLLMNCLAELVQLIVDTMIPK
jgi:hypothetical protein